MGFYTKKPEKKTGDGLALTEWNDLNSAVGGDAGLTLALHSSDKMGVGTEDPDAKLSVARSYSTKLNETKRLLSLTADVPSAKQDNIEDGFGAHIAFGAQRGGPKPSTHIGGFFDYFLRAGSKSDADRWGFRFRLRDNDTWKNILHLLSNGRVGIGTDTPQNALDVEGTVAVGAQYAGEKAAPAGGMIVKGKVGIGTPTPSTKLHVDGNTTFDGQVKIQPGTGKTGLDMASGDAYAEMRVIRNSKSSNKKLYLNWGVDKGAIGMYSDTEIDGKLKVTGTVTANKFVGDGSKLTNLKVGPTGLNLATSTGAKVGIGTSEPSTKLHVDGNTTLDGQVKIQPGAGNTGLDMASGDAYAEMRVIRNSKSSNKKLYLNWGVDKGAIGMYSDTDIQGDLAVSGAVTMNSTLTFGAKKGYYVFDHVFNDLGKFDGKKYDTKLKASDYYAVPIKTFSDYIKVITESGNLKIAFNENDRVKTRILILFIHKDFAGKFGNVEASIK